MEQIEYAFPPNIVGSCFVWDWMNSAQKSRELAFDMYNDPHSLVLEKRTNFFFFNVILIFFLYMASPSFYVASIVQKHSLRILFHFVDSALL